VNQKYPETGYKLCKFCENRARDMPLQGIYIPHFDQISVKISVLGYYTLIVAVMGVKFGTEEATFGGPLLRAKFHSHRCNVFVPVGRKTSKSASE